MSRRLTFPDDTAQEAAMSTTTAQTGECPTCGRRFRLTVDDTIRHHLAQRRGNGRYRAPRCEGAGKYPKLGTVQDT